MLWDTRNNCICYVEDMIEERRTVGRPCKSSVRNVLKKLQITQVSRLKRNKLKEKASNRVERRSDVAKTSLRVDKKKKKKMYTR